MSCGCWPVGVLHAYLPTSVPGERLEVSSCGVASPSRVHAPITAWHVVIEQAWALRPQHGALSAGRLWTNAWVPSCDCQRRADHGGAIGGLGILVVGAA